MAISLYCGSGGSNNSCTVLEPHPTERVLAHEFIDAGADVILGHHPPIRWYEESGPARHTFLEGRDKCVPISDDERNANPNLR